MLKVEQLQEQARELEAALVSARTAVDAAATAEKQAEGHEGDLPVIAAEKALGTLGAADAERRKNEILDAIERARDEKNEAELVVEELERRLHDKRDEIAQAEALQAASKLAEFERNRTASTELH